MKIVSHILILIFFTALSARCQNIGDKQNPLYGIVYRNISEIKQLKNFYQKRGSVVDVMRTNPADYEFALVEMVDTIKNRHVILFEKLIHDSINQKAPKYLILDTITIDFTIDSQYVSFFECSKDGVSHPEIIAFVYGDSRKVYYFENIIKAWYADIKTGRIELLEELKNIKCVNSYEE